MAKLKLSNELPSRIPGDAIAILGLKNRKFTIAGNRLNREFKNKLTETLQSESFLVKYGNVLVYFTGRPRQPRILVVAAPMRATRCTELRDAAYASARAAQQHGVLNLTIAFDPENDVEVQAIGEGALLATYRYKPFQSRKDPKPKLSSITVCSAREGQKGLRRATVFASAAMLVRDLVNEPPNILNASRLSSLSQEIAKKQKLDLKIYHPAELEKMGAHAFLSVGKGSPVESKMIQITYRPSKKPVAHFALVGKGITFDSGGLSLKTEKAMEHMKTDMSGAATVLACVQAASELRLPVQVTGLLMVTENMPDGGANRPGDVVRAMNGKTIEITNTDAEGRLALADGLTFAQRLSPDYLIDVATLTGAQVVSLGRLAAGVMGNNQEFIQMIVEAGEKSGEIMWPLPLVEHYRELIKSDTADLRNSSGIPEAGSIQAGLFLSEFVEHPRWAHLDIAGPAWQEREWSVYSRNASGFATRCLLTLLSEGMKV